MRRHHVLALTLVAGCSFELTTAGVGGDATPRDAGADAREVDALDAPPPNPDIDGDTILNAADNCPSVANTNQRNHDGDNRGDACDVCPHLPSTIHADNDADGIGDDCDPRPQVGGDTVALFDGFYPDSQALGWDKVGTWTLDANTLRQTGMGIAYVVVPGPMTRTFVQASALVEQVFNTTSTIGVFAGDSYPASTQSYGCLAQRNGVAQTIVTSAKWVGGTGFSPVAWSGMFAQGQTLKFELELDAAASCNVQHNNNVGTDVENVGPLTGRYGIYLDDVSTRFDYLFVVQIGS